MLIYCCLYCSTCSGVRFSSLVFKSFAALSHVTINLSANLLAALSTVSAAYHTGFTSSHADGNTVLSAGLTKDFTHHCLTH
jgi:hypothetical protein